MTGERIPYGQAGRRERKERESTIHRKWERQEMTVSLRGEKENQRQ